MKNMKKNILILGVNALAFTLILAFSPQEAKADFVKMWDDEWTVPVGGPNGAMTHSCFRGSRLITCVEYSTLGNNDLID